ncbi:MAG: hypothetical protein H7338_22365, partial [Candidatus Sericytochromatia bacterium]|nr:hypothetical protein [Candidatus Sericytochromatia bacterium]
MVQPTSRQEPASGIHTPPVKAVPRVEPTLPEAPLRPLIKDGQRVSQRGTSASTLAIETIASQASSRADAIDQAATKVTGGNAVARRFNSLVNVLTHDQQTLGQARQNAIQAYRTDLPHALAEYRTLTAKAGKDPVKQQAAQAFLQGAIAKADKAGQAFDRSLQALGGTNKFWSGLTADVGAGMLVMGTAAIASRRFGVPIGPKLIAAGFGGGGAATVGTHAMLDNQYDLRHEGAANFLVGGMGSAGMLWAGKAFQVPTLSMKRLVVSQAVVGAATGSAGAIAQEASTGFKKGWGGRVALSTVVGTAVGAGAGALTPVLAKSLGLSATTLARRSTQMALGLTTGGIAGGGAALANEAFTGFSEGWQSRLKQQSLGGALAGTVYAAAPQLASRRIASGQLSHPTTAAPLIPESVRTVLSAKLKDMGLPTTDLNGGDALLSRLLQDDALSSLRLQVLNDPTIAPEVRSRLAAYSTEAMTAGLQTPEAKLMRLDMLAMALPKATRQLLTASIGKHLQTHSDHLKQFVRQHPTESAWDVVVVGGGSQGTIIGHEANTKGAGHSVLIMDQGVGEGNFGTLREFYMNTLNGVHDGGVVAQKGRSKNPVHGSPVQPSDLSAEMFPTAAAMGDASTIGLYGAQKAGTDVMTGTKVLKVQENKGQGWPARYRIEAGDGTVVFANKVVFSTGLAGEPNLPNHAGTKALVKQEMALIEAQDPQAIATQRLLTDNQLLTLANQADDPLAVWRTTDAPTYIIGGGDAAKIPAELPLGLAPGS